MQMVVIERGREIPREQAPAVLLGVSARFREKRERNDARIRHRLSKLHGAPDRMSVQKAMLAIEDRIVSAFWVLARLPNDRGNGFASKHGIDYMPDREERFANAVEAGGKWEQDRPRPPIPSGKEIDAMDTPLEWLRLLDREHARILSIGAQWKRGESCRRVSWPRVRDRHLELRDYSTRTLQRRYSDALRTIAAELTHRKIAS